LHGTAARYSDHPSRPRAELGSASPTPSMLRYDPSDQASAKFFEGAIEGLRRFRRCDPVYRRRRLEDAGRLNLPCFTDNLGRKGNCCLCRFVRNFELPQIDDEAQSGGTGRVGPSGDKIRMPRSSSNSNLIMRSSCRQIRDRRRGLIFASSCRSLFSNSVLRGQSLRHRHVLQPYVVGQTVLEWRIGFAKDKRCQIAAGRLGDAEAIGADEVGR
jgi:hypothetical protein